MTTIRSLLNERFQQAMRNADIPAECEAHIAPSKNPDFGDYQANGAMGAAKKLGQNPRQLAQSIVDHLKLEDIASKVEIAGPGFINIHLSRQWLSESLTESAPYKNLPVSETPQTVVVDYSGPNLAKEMHVGHLRSTIIGDAVVRTLRSLGHTVIPQNHVGDWGTQFGMLIAELEQQLNEGEQAELALSDLESFYKQAKKHFDDDENFANLARQYVVKLQSGDEKTLKLWQQFRHVSLIHSKEIYQLLGVGLTDEDIRGESFYNNDLPVLVKELKAQGLAVEDQGAQVVFLQELADKKGNPSPVIVQKQGGGYLYSTSDLAAIRFRAGKLKADRVIVFSDARQALHMKQVYTIAKKAGFAAEDTLLEHCPFGMMMGPDGRPFKTRSGDNIKLADLLLESIERAKLIIKEKNPDFSDDDIAATARNVGIGAIKYADLSKTRTLDYIFDWNQMLSFEGNTGPYLQYAYTRIQSIFRKAEIVGELGGTPIIISEPQEKALALKLMQLSETIDSVGREATPHVLCNYLYELASLFMSFYEACPILKEGTAETQRNSRLHLSQQVAETMKFGLNLLGIEVMDRM